jgi:hypothetical protein
MKIPTVARMLLEIWLLLQGETSSRWDKGSLLLLHLTLIIILLRSWLVMSWLSSRHEVLGCRYEVLGSRYEVLGSISRIVEVLL